jgi:hypothetical protein
MMEFQELMMEGRWMYMSTSRFCKQERRMAGRMMMSLIRC